MQPIIACKKCGTKMSLDEALLDQIKQETAQEISKEHQQELNQQEKRIRDEVNADTQKQIQEAQQKAAEQSNNKYEQTVKGLQTETEEEKKNSNALREQLTQLMVQLRESNRARENAELDMQKKLAEEEHKIREEAEKTATEKQRLNLAERDKRIDDLKKALEDAQRKASQGSQQMQGEIMELDIETIFSNAFRDDEIEPVAKGVKGGDIRQIVKSQSGINCGVVLWEIKRTKNWSDGWVSKLKDDMRETRADISVIITEVMPKHILDEMGSVDGVWVCKPKMAIILATLLRKNLLDVGRQKAIAESRGTKEEALYTFVTSHEFAQQVEAMVETYTDMAGQIVKERAAAERMWSLREKQAQRLLLGTANIIGGIQGNIGQASMPKIKGLELLGAGSSRID